MNEKKKRRVTLLGVVKILFTVSLIVIVLFPLVWMAVGSFKMEKEILGYPPTVFGTKYTLKSFQRIFKTIPMAAYIKNTVIFAGGSTFLAVLFDSLTGYAFARLNFKGKDILFMLVLLTMMVPFQVMMIPLFLESNLRAFGHLRRTDSAEGHLGIRHLYDAVLLRGSSEGSGGSGKSGRHERIRYICKDYVPAGNTGSTDSGYFPSDAELE